MRVHRVHLFVNLDNSISVKAAIDVPGLGEVEIEHALSDELARRVTDEAIVSLRVKLGQVIEKAGAQ